MSVNIITNFNLNAPLPLDNRSVVNTYSDLTTISPTRRYHGMRVWVIGDSKSYYLTTSNTWQAELPPASSSNVQSVGGTVGYLPKYTSVGSIYQINNSIISDNGTTANIEGSLNVTNSISTPSISVTTTLNLGSGITIPHANIATLPLNKISIGTSSNYQIIKNVSGIVSWANNEDIYVTLSSSNQFRPVLFSGDTIYSASHKKINIGSNSINTLQYNPGTTTLRVRGIIASEAIITTVNATSIFSTNISNTSNISSNTINVGTNRLIANSTGVTLRGNVNLSSTNGVPLRYDVQLIATSAHTTGGAFWMNTTYTGITYATNPDSVTPIPAKNYDRFIVFANNSELIYASGTHYVIISVAFTQHWNVMFNLRSYGEFDNGQCYVYVPAGTPILLSILLSNPSILPGSKIGMIYKEIRLG